MAILFPRFRLNCWFLVLLCVAAGPELPATWAAAEEVPAAIADDPSAKVVKDVPADRESSPKQAEVEPKSDPASDAPLKVSTGRSAKPASTSIAIQAKERIDADQPPGVLPPDKLTVTPCPEGSANVEPGSESAATNLGIAPDEKAFIGAIAMVLEKQSQLYFPARVDTGAQSCSIHVDKIKIEDRAKSMKGNIGKVARIKLKNHADESQWVETRINRLVRIKTADQVELRYVVPLTLAYDGLEKEVRVTLNDRSTMTYPLLLGRNFLRGHFVVDVDTPIPE